MMLVIIQKKSLNNLDTILKVLEKSEKHTVCFYVLLLFETVSNLILLKKYGTYKLPKYERGL